MATVADVPPTADAPPIEAATEAPATVGPGAPEAPAPASASPGATCRQCGSEMAPGQDWCLQCGAGAPGSLGRAGWRSGALAIGGAAVLALGAAAAAVAALNSSPKKAAVVIATVARVTPPAAVVTPPASTSTTTTPPSTVAKLPLTPIKPPRIPLTASTPKAAVGGTTKAPTSTTPTTTTTPATGGGTETAAKPQAILLDTNAASTYNPYGLPATDFGDPSLAIDGESGTGWTAQVEAATAPAMAVGLQIDLRVPEKLGSFTLVTSTPGLTIQVYGANGSTVPNSITATGWTRLTHSTVIHKRHEHLKLLEPTKGFRWVVLWVSRAPAAAVGSATAPGHVSINEVELFPPS